MTGMKTIDTDFAAAMMARGAKLDGWEKSADKRKLYWRLSEINPDWITQYRDGQDNITRFVANKRFLVNVAKTEITRK